MPPHMGIFGYALNHEELLNMGSKTQAKVRNEIGKIKICYLKFPNTVNNIFHRVFHLFSTL
jgi:hypothetical protein